MNNFQEWLNSSNIKVENGTYKWYGLSLSEKFVRDRYQEKKMRTIYVCSVYGDEDNY